MRVRIVVAILIFMACGVSARAGGEGCCWREKVRVVGRVVEWRPPLLMLRTASGRTVYVRVGPYRFWHRLRLDLNPGERVWVEGWRCGEVLIPEILGASGGRLRLRDERGWPIWRKRNPELEW